MEFCSEALDKKAYKYRDTFEAICKKAEAEGRALTPQELKDCETLTEKVVLAREAADHARRFEDMSRGLDASIGPMRPLGFVGDAGLKYVRRELRPGEVRMVRHDEAVADAPYVGPGIGAFVRGIVTGKMPTELRAMGETTLGAGGWLVPTPLAHMVIDLLRNQTQVIRAGAMTVPMDAATLKIARLTGDIQSNWKSENAAGTASDNSFDAVTFTAQTLFALAKFSVELAEDAPNLDSIVGNSIAKSLALELDRVALYGTGVAPQPKGVKNQTGIQTASMGTNGASFTDYSQLNTAIAALKGANLQGPFGIITSTRTEGELSGLQDTLHQPLRKPDLVAAARFFSTNQIPNNLTVGTGTTCSDAFIGQWDQLLIGMRTQMLMEVSRVAADATSSAFTNGQVWVRAYLRADIQLAHPQAFYVLSGIL